MLLLLKKPLLSAAQNHMQKFEFVTTMHAIYCERKTNEDRLRFAQRQHTNFSLQTL